MHFGKGCLHMKRKIIPCLDIKAGRVVKGINFVNLKDMGSPLELAKYYSDQGADELVFLDITRSQDQHALMLETIKEVTSVIDIPLTVGGGIQTLADAEAVLNAGASKVSIASAAVRQPELINQISQKFGSARITIAIDTAYDSEAKDYFIYTQGGKEKENYTLVDWSREAEKRGAGSLLITSIHHDGVKNGFDLPALELVSQAVTIPLIASGGAGSSDDFIELFKQTQIEAGLAASIFHQGTVLIPQLKKILTAEGIEIG